MALIRTKRTPNNPGGRGGCLLHSPYTNAVWYVTVEQGMIIIRDYAGNAHAEDGPIALVAPHVSACFANPGEVCVNIAGFIGDDPQTRTGMDTYLLPLAE